jgi:acetyl esterase
MNAAGGPKLYELSIGDARAALAALAGDSASVTGFAGSCENRTISGPGGAIPLRLYWPEKTGETLLPVLVFFHGGGFALGNLDSHDAICRQLCIRANVIVVNVDYRQPPEHRFPAAPQDCYAALQWTAENAAALGGDKARIAVAGDSAGANLAAVVSLMAKERNGPALTMKHGHARRLAAAIIFSPTRTCTGLRACIFPIRRTRKTRSPPRCSPGI